MATINTQNKKDIVKKKTKQETIEYWNYACAMDTETSSFYNDEGEKVALMYTHQWMIEDHFYLGRTWDSFREVMKKLQVAFGLSHTKRLVIYVHNLPYEFQFMRKEIPIDSCFATDDRKSIKVVSGGIEFRDSLILTQKSLAKVGEEVGIQKLKEKMDYYKIRTPLTPLTKQEWKYCYNDVKILVELIRKKIKQDGTIVKIPMTNTGYVRNFVREKCHEKKNYRDYRKLMDHLTITPSEYKMLKAAFQGGFTHSNARYNNILIEEEMESQDFTSSYPAVILAEKFPMSKAMKTTAKTIEDIHSLEEKGYGMLLDITFKYLEEKKDAPDNILSESKCIEKSESMIVNNGRVVWGEHVRTVITNIDLEMMEKFYNWETYKINKVICYRMGYLPKPIIECVWHFYKNKTELKGVEGKEEEYQILKGMLNAIYGMMVTDIVRDDIIYEEEWSILEADIEEQIRIYNESETRFLFYPWGVFVTAYARRNLLNGILEAGEDYVYADTDSRKILHPEKHRKYVENYNRDICEKIKETFKFHGLEYSEPEDIKGHTHPIGVWDYDGTYRRFKTLGAKRYMYETKDGKIGFTVAGIPKKNGKKFMMSRSKRIKWDEFTFDLKLDESQSGKLCSTYIDEPRMGYVRDYMGTEYEYNVKTSVHLEKTTASITLSAEFEKYLLGIQKERVH